MKKYYLFFACLFACQSELIELDKNSKKDAPLVTTQPAKPVALRVDYDVETVTTTAPANPADESRLTDFDKISMQPRVHREKVFFSIFEDGTSKMVIEKKVPKQPLTIQHDVPPDDSPEVVYSVAENGTLRFYDATYNPIGEPMPNYKKLLDDVKNGVRDEGNLQGQFAGGAGNVLRSQQQTPTGDKPVLKQKKEFPNGTAKIVTESDKGTQVSYYDNNHKVILASALYGKNKRLIFGNVLKYKQDAKGKPNLVAADEKLLIKNANGIEMKVRNYKNYHHFKITNNIKK